MGRPVSEGFAYFYHDVDMSSDEKVELLEERHILTGYAVYNKLLERIYRSGGYLEIVLPETTKVLARKFKVTEDELKEIISSCVEFDLFSNELYEEKVITSKGILTRAKSLHDNRLNSRKKQGDNSLTETEKQFYNYYQTITKEKSKNEISKVKKSISKVKESKEEELVSDSEFGNPIPFKGNLESRTWIISFNGHSKEFQKEWIRYLDYRAMDEKNKNYLDAKSQEHKLKELSDITKDDIEAAKIIEQTISNQWIRFFSLKNNNDHGTHQQPTTRATAKFKSKNFDQKF